MQILYVGKINPDSTSKHRSLALERLGHRVTRIDPWDVMKCCSRLVGAAHYRTGYRFIQTQVMAWLSHQLGLLDTGVDLIWVDSGELLGPACLRSMKALGAPVVLFNHDDPTGRRDGRRFDSLVAAIPHYELCAVCREINVHEFYEAGAKAVVKFTRGYDELAHLPLVDANQVPSRFKADVAFIGTWMPGERRDEFILELASRGIEIAIWGDSWNRSKYWRGLQRLHRGPAVYGREYVCAIQGAKLCLGLLSRKNRDESTTRSAEIPYAGGLLCAERTSEHIAMYREGEEAVFWSDSHECAETCLRLLKDDSLRESIRIGGRRRVLELSIGNEDICRAILERALA